MFEKEHGDDKREHWRRREEVEVASKNMDHGDDGGSLEMRC